MALDLPGGARERLAEWRDGLVGGREDLRPVPPESLHLTLVFIGHRPEEDVPAIAAAVEGAAAGLEPALLRPLRVVAVPRRGPARLFALDLEDGSGRAGEAQAAVSAALAAGGWHEPERRPFWPHITLARVRRGQRPAPLTGEPPAEDLPASEVTLYRSHLSPRGARYEPLVRVSL